MICRDCQQSADYPELSPAGHTTCINKVKALREGVYEARSPDEHLRSCDCQHHPVGTRQIKKEAK